MRAPKDDVAAVLLSGLTKQFSTVDGSVQAVDGIDLQVPQGQIMAFLGPNGAGKTTTLDMVLGLTEPTGGRVRTQGLPPRQAVRAGLSSAVLQSGGLLRDLSVRETVRLIASCIEGAAPADEVLERAGLIPLVDRQVSKCSGGEQQRLRFALSMLSDPGLLILDEPTAGMDVAARQDFWDAMRVDSGRGRTVVFATHYLEEANAFAERIVMVNGGRIVADGTPEEIRATVSGHTVSARVDRGFHDDVCARLSARDDVHAVKVEGDRVVVTTADSDSVAMLLLRDLGGSGLQVAPASLDRAFMALTSNGGAPADGADGRMAAEGAGGRVQEAGG